MKTNKFGTIAFLVATVVFATTSCKKEKANQEDNDNEVITTVELNFTEQGTSNTTTFKWQDLDGDGGNAPVVDNIELAPNKTYAVTLRLLDETKSPVDNVTEEVEAESQDHRFYFTPSANSNITVSSLNNDTNGIPLGTTSTWTTTTDAEGTIGIILRHYPDGGKATEDPVNSTKSSTDVDVRFMTVIAE